MTIYFAIKQLSVASIIHFIMFFIMYLFDIIFYTKNYYKMKICTLLYEYYLKFMIFKKE